MDLFLLLPIQLSRRCAPDLLCRSVNTGFYYIALQAKVPICLAYIDFPGRTIGFNKMLYPSGNIDKDFEIIETFYQDKIGKFPDNQGVIRIKER
jgi:hypothetical protein